MFSFWLFKSIKSEIKINSESTNKIFKFTLYPFIRQAIDTNLNLNCLSRQFQLFNALIRMFNDFLIYLVTFILLFINSHAEQCMFFCFLDSLYCIVGSKKVAHISQLLYKSFEW